MGNLVEIHDLTVRFKDFAALKKVNGKITNRPGVVGLIGPNGAGKQPSSTLFLVKNQ